MTKVWTHIASMAMVVVVVQDKEEKYATCALANGNSTVADKQSRQQK